jgi:hypothetical protein
MLADGAQTAAYVKGMGMLELTERFAIAAAMLAAVLLAVLAPSHAAAAAATCGDRVTSQPFLAWLDTKRYFLLPGGDLETSAGWTLGGGAKIAEGNEPFFVHGSSDHRSLLLPSGGWARTAATCVDSNEPTMRFFVRNTGSALSALLVEARIRTTLLGVTLETPLPLGVVPGTAREWQPSLPVPFKLSVNQLLGGTTSVDFRFTAVGLGGAWQVDDVYVDPFKQR